MKPIQVGLLGIGTVGSGTFNVLKRNQEEITRRAGRGIEITMVADLDAVAHDVFRTLGVEIGHHGDLDTTASTALDLFLVALQHVEGATANRANAQQAHLNRFHIGIF